MITSRLVKTLTFGALTVSVSLLSPIAARAATVTVGNFADDGTPGTLRYIINNANDGDVIQIPAGLPIVLTAAGAAIDTDGDEDLDVTKSITIQGAGADATVIDADGPVTGDSVFEIDPNNDGIGAVIEGVTVQNGAVGGIVINDAGALTLLNSVVTGNSSGSNGGGIFVGEAAILLADGSKISNNTAGSGGGGVYLSLNASLFLVNGSEISSNTASSNGGGIGSDSGNSCDMSIADSRIVDNTSTGGAGGGVYQYWGANDFRNVEVSGNKAPSSDGGGLYLEYTTGTIQNCLITGNQAGDAGNDQYGGGISAYYSALHITDSTISNNRSSQYGGGIYNYLSSVIENTTISGNIADFDTTASGGGGGGVYNEGGLILQNVVIEGNSANNDSVGGGIYSSTSDNGPLLIEDSLIRGNTATDNNGGGIYYEGYSMNIRGSTITGNRALGDQAGGSEDSQGGGIYNLGEPLAITNTTIVGNSADGSGGGIFNSDNDGLGVLTLKNVTIAKNTADANSGGVSGGDGGGIFNGGTLGSPDDASVRLLGTIIAGNVDASAGSEAPDCFNNFIIDKDPLGAQAPSLIQNLDDCELQGDPTLVITGDPLFDGELADNDGKTAGDPETPVIVGTLKLQSASPAIDAGQNSTCEDVDQRGVERPIDGNGDGEARCDLGAVEAEVSGSATGGDTGGDTTGGDTTGGDTGGDSGGGCSLVTATSRSEHRAAGSGMIR